MRTQNIIAGTLSAQGPQSMQTTNPATQKKLPDQFYQATSKEVDIAAQEAASAWQVYKKVSGKEKGLLLRTIAKAIEALGDRLIRQAIAETGLTEARLKGERARTINQIYQFANLVEEGSWVEAILDLPNDSTKNDLRKMLLPIGPVAVFTASNFPLAFSTAGGDTISALTAGCSVIIKAHPAHLGTNALVAEAIDTAIKQCQLPAGIFSSLNGGIEVGRSLVAHPEIKAVGFTGSFQGGKALFDLANTRPQPIPVYAEMGSINPLFILPEKMAQAPEALAKEIAHAVNLGAGQFCTNPGLLVIQEDSNSKKFLAALETIFKNQLQASTMLHQGIYEAYESNKAKCLGMVGVDSPFPQTEGGGEWRGAPSFATIPAERFLRQDQLQEEVFGPFTLLVICKTSSEYTLVANALQGQLTASIFGVPSELEEAIELIDLLSQKVGRIIFNGVPTGVQVSPAMHHGGPYPATINVSYTSVGTDAIKRFVRPICFQNAPEKVLPKTLQSDNPLQIARKIHTKKT